MRLRPFNTKSFYHGLIERKIQKAFPYKRIEIFIKNSSSFIVVCFCHPPETSKHLPLNFKILSRNQVKSLTKENKEIIILIDFTINHHDTKANSDNEFIVNFHQIFQLISYFFQQLILRYLIYSDLESRFFFGLGQVPVLSQTPLFVLDYRWLHNIPIS